MQKGDEGTVFFQLKKMGITSAKAEYYGGGDEGWIEEVVLFGSDGDPISNQKAEELVSDFVYENLPGGWEINEGSQGDVEIDTHLKTAKFNHTNYYTESDYQPFEVSE